MRPHPATSVLFRTMRLLEAANLFFLLTTVLVAALFVLGNFQEFLDSSQSMLLSMLSFASTLCVASGVSYVIALTIWMIRRGHLMLLRFFYGLVAVLVGVALAVAGGALETLVRPL